MSIASSEINSIETVFAYLKRMTRQRVVELDLKEIRELTGAKWVKIIREICDGFTKDQAVKFLRANHADLSRILQFGFGKNVPFDLNHNPGKYAMERGD